MSWGGLVALLVLVSTLVLFLIGRLEPAPAGLFAALAVAILISGLPLAWRGPVA